MGNNKSSAKRKIYNTKYLHKKMEISHTNNLENI